MPERMSSEHLVSLIGAPRAPVVVDVRREEARTASGRRIAGSIRCPHMETGRLVAEHPAGTNFVVYCVHGHNVSEIAAARLSAAGGRVSVLAGGFEAYAAAGGPTVRLDVPGVAPSSQPTVWVTRERPKIDRIACPWLIRRFFDPAAVIHFVAAEWVKEVAAELEAIPFDVDGVFYSHRGAECSFDTMVAEFGLADPAVDHVARIVRAADTARLDLEPQAAGLLALSLGLSAIEASDDVQLERGMLLYDALLGWCRHAAAETHNWPAKAA